MNPDRLGAIDETYLAIETAAAPLHVASIGIFEAAGLCDERGRLRLAAIRDRLEARLDLLPRLRQRVATVPLGVARPVWIDDEDFDIAQHVDTVALGHPHDEAALLALAEDLVMQRLPRDRPLWHLRFVTGLEGDRVALIERAHHAMVDGVSGVDVSVALLDSRPDAPTPRPEPWVPQPAPTAGSLLSDGIADAWRAPVSAVAAVAGSLRHPGSVVHDLTEAARGLATVRRDGVRAPHCSLNVPIGSKRRLDLVRQRFEPVHAVARSAGATVNDVVLTAVASGLRELFLERGELLPSDREVKVLVPVSVRTAEQSMALGNRVGALLANVPVGIGDPNERLHAIAATTKALKSSAEAATADRLLHAADLVPLPLARLLQHRLANQPLVNLVVTNIPGPPFPLYALGSRMLEAFPVVPLGLNMSLEVAVLSYDGALNLCVTSDRHACPDAGVFAGGMDKGFTELRTRWAPALA